jgi:2,5-dioxopentanoate dehydrogenase
VNPVFLFPGAAVRRGGDLARAYVTSLTLGAGQFCTNPGLLFGVDGPALEDFVVAAATALAEAAAQTMLSDGIAANYALRAQRLEALDGSRVVARGRHEPLPNRGQAMLLTVDAGRFVADPAFSEEVFGASSLVVRVRSTTEFAELARSLEGQLTATLLYEPDDVAAVRSLMPVLERRVGRIIGNGWPTGVEVASAMVHGGPYPATSDGRSTSVGDLAIQRFLRPVCYQDLDDALLPRLLADDNPWNVPRRVDDIWTRP